MSTIIAPDPYPGRCKNHRSELHNGQFVSLRCLDYENTVHVCTFQRPLAGPQGRDGMTYSLQTSRKPQPWVKP